VLRVTPNEGVSSLRTSRGLWITPKAPAFMCDATMRSKRPERPRLGLASSLPAAVGEPGGPHCQALVIH
jgi:hypothetical protein